MRSVRGLACSVLAPNLGSEGLRRKDAHWLRLRRVGEQRVADGPRLGLRVGMEGGRAQFSAPVRGPGGPGVRTECWKSCSHELACSSASLLGAPLNTCKAAAIDWIVACCDAAISKEKGFK